MFKDSLQSFRRITSHKSPCCCTTSKGNHDVQVDTCFNTQASTLFIFNSLERKIRALISKWYLIGLLCFVLQSITNAQNNLLGTPPAPTPAALGKFGSIPVGYQNGTVQLAIPLYEIDVNGFKLPIRLDYHSSGVRLSEVASNTGMSWVLQAGGVITRSVRGKPDEGTGGFAVSTGGMLTEKWCSGPYSGPATIGEMWSDISHFDRDGEPDSYYFNFAGRSGSFTNAFDGKIIPSPYQNIQIIRNNKYTWTIITEDGTQFIFGTSEYSNSYVSCVPTMTYSDQAFIGTKLYADNYQSSWYLTQIKFPNSDKTIDFEYSNSTAGPTYLMPGSSSVYTYTPETWGETPCPQYTRKFNEACVFLNTGIDAKHLKKIKWPTGEIEFVLGSARCDLLNDFPVKELYVRKYIQQNVVDEKKYMLRYNYLSPSGSFIAETTTPPFETTDQAKYRLFLMGVEELSYQKGIKGKNYDLEYYLGSSGLALPSRISILEDRWGFYNGTPSVSTHDSDFNSTRIGALKTITYPTGGATTFTYSPHDLGFYGQGGLRIVKMEDYDPITNKKNIKTFSYLGSAYVLSYQYPQPHKVVEGKLIEHPDNDPLGFCSPYYYTVTTFNAFGPLNCLPNGQVGGYENVSVSENLSDGNATVTSYEFTMARDEYDITCTNVMTPYVLYALVSPYAPASSNEWKRGLLLSEKISKKKDGVFVPVKLTKNSYNYYGKNDLQNANITSVKGVKFAMVNPEGEYDAYGGIMTAPTYDYQFYNLWNGYSTLKQKIETTYTENGDVEQTTDYVYDDNLQLKSKNTTLSDGVEKKTTYRYPYDFTGTNTTQEANAILNLTTAHRINQLVEELQFIKKPGDTDFKLEKGSLATFLNFGNYVLPYRHLNFNTFQPTSAYETTSIVNGLLHYDNYNPANNDFTGFEGKITYDKYDTHGNAIEYHKDRNFSSSLLWGYNRSFPIAIIENATSDKVAHTSFEDEYTEKWSVSNTAAVIDTDSRTGNYCLQGNASTVSLLLTPPSGRYNISYWAKNGTPSISGTAIVSEWVGVEIVNDWKYYEKVIDVSTSNPQLTFTGLLDEVRLYPANSSMVTCTYNPGNGLSSQTDANNNTTYFEYDSLGRLMLVRDYKGKIVKHYDYAYKVSK